MQTKKKLIFTTRSAKLPGPYSQAVVMGHTVYVSSMIGLDRKGNLVEGGVRAQTEQAILNIRSVLEEAYSSLSKIVKMKIVMKKHEDSAKMWKEIRKGYRRFGIYTAPAQTIYEVEKLPMDALVAIEVIGLTNG